MFLDEKTVLEISLNPGLNLTIFQGTGLRLLTAKITKTLLWLVLPVLYRLHISTAVF